MPKKFSEFPPKRRAKILEMRAKIAADTARISYKMDIAVDRLLDDALGVYKTPIHQRKPTLVECRKAA